jgi:hypothetical protein
MSELGAALLLFLLLLASSALGVFLQNKLAEHHRARETVDAVRLVISILVTFTALVLGLLTSSVKTSFDEFGAGLRGYGADIIALDQRLRDYGAGAEAARALMRRYVAAAVADTWPHEPRPSGDYPTKVKSLHAGSIEGEELGALLTRVDGEIRRLPPADRIHQQLADLLEARMTRILEGRWRLIETGYSTISWPLMALMTSWLIMIFAVFGLSSPRNAVVYATIALCAVSISSAVFMILELDTPLGGWVVVSSQPLRDALLNIDAPAP